MKFLKCLSIGVVFLSLSACSKIPSECEEAWDKVEKLGKQVGVTKDELKIRKQEFEENITQMDREQAKQICTSQNSFLEFAK